LPLFPPHHPALSSEGGRQGSYPKGETTLKSSFRTFVLAAFAATTSLAFAHSASAQFYARYASQDDPVAYDRVTTPNAVILPYAGTHVTGGQLPLINESNQPATVWCWMSSQAESLNGSLPDGPASTVTDLANGYVTLPLNGYYFASGPSELYVNCEDIGPSGPSFLSLNGNVMATLVN
jgi:hypothetical protein